MTPSEEITKLVQEVHAWMLKQNCRNATVVISNDGAALMVDDMYIPMKVGGSDG